MTRQHNSVETREMIINSAVDNFLSKGYTKTTLEDIVKPIGLTRGAFYWNFDSKKDIMDEIVKRYEQFYLDIYEGFERDASAYKTLKNFLLLNLKSKNKQNPYVTIIRYKVEASEELSDLKERQANLDNRSLMLLETEINRGKKQGEFRTDKGADLMALILYTYLLGFGTYNTVHYSEKTGLIMPEKIIEQHVDFLMSTLV